MNTEEKSRGLGVGDIYGDGGIHPFFFYIFLNFFLKIFEDDGLMAAAAMGDRDRRW